MVRVTEADWPHPLYERDPDPVSRWRDPEDELSPRCLGGEAPRSRLLTHPMNEAKVMSSPGRRRITVGPRWEVSYAVQLHP